ncbi:low molecular weight protein-tyrosine-phosphatase [Rubrobacter naiadicus]|uniref:low molecular weight protein-tyrosine-phosphatase n=1 Tax=Rubrobacter naiadicus TaxID=1392641 RepID=UPI00236034DB|nr:low molecular weight protein-tyrosine-phosphatase [Rubrobacter naiadicus]
MSGVLDPGGFPGENLFFLRVYVHDREVRLVRVLFVCMGNICRSPIAQGIFEEMVRREGLEGEILVDSAGVGSWHIGEPPDPRAQEVALRRGVDISGQRARQISPEDCESFDYILTMDEENYRAVSSLCPDGRAGVRPFLDFADVPQTEVPDPYYGGPEGFEHVALLLEKAAGGLLEEIRRKHLKSNVL